MNHIALLQAKGATDVIVTNHDFTLTQVKFANSSILTAKTWDSNDLELFAVFGKKMSATTLQNPAAIPLAADAMASLAKHMPDNPMYDGIAKAPQTYAKVDGLYDPAIIDADVMDMVHEQLNLAQELLPGCQCAGVLELANGTEHIESSGGIDVQDKGTTIYFSMRVMKGDASGHMVTAGRSFKTDLAKATSFAADVARTAAALPVRKLKPGPYQTLLAPLPAANLLDHVGSATSMFHVESQMSHLGGKLGKQVASPIFTLSDCPHLSDGYHSTAVDEEGQATADKTLIENGVLKRYLHNTSTAKRNNGEPGNAGLIAPEPFNMVVDPGEHTEEELRQEAQLYMTNVWYTRFQNMATGDFSTIPRDGCFIMEKGEPVATVKNIRVTENLQGVFERIEALGKERVQVRGWEVETPCVLPQILAKDLNISAPFS